MTRISKKTMKRQGTCEEPACNDYSDAEFSQECEKEKQSRHRTQLNRWSWLSVLLVIVFIFGCTNIPNWCGFDPVEKAWSWFTWRWFNGQRGRVTAKSIDADLGVERPDLLPLTTAEIKRAEIRKKKEDKEKAEKFKKQHEDRNYCVFDHGRGCNGHDRCIYCGKKKEDSYASNRKRH